MTQRPSYAGLCIGGPRDGEWLVRRYPLYNVAVNRSGILSALEGQIDQPGVSTTSYCVYTYTDLVEGVSAWLAEGTGRKVAMTRLLAAYEKGKKNGRCS